jgi:hypothetical protein
LSSVANCAKTAAHKEEKINLDEKLATTQSVSGTLMKNMVAELSGEDLRGFRNYMRISPELFQELLERVGPRLMKKDTFTRKALELGHRLAIALRYMASGDSYMSLSYNYRVAPNTIDDV